MMESRITQFKFVDGLKSLITEYDLLICDIWGVLHNGLTSFLSASEALVAARKAGKTVILLSNAPRPSKDVMEQLAYLGIGKDAYDAVITSGDVTQDLLREKGAEPVFLLGPERDLPIFDGLIAELTTLENARYVLCTGLFKDEAETPDDYETMLRYMLTKNLVMICANPDLIVDKGDMHIYCAGAIAERYGAMGGRVTLIGKPFSIVYERVFSMYEKITGVKPLKNRVLAIGDAIRTDVMGAVQYGIDSLFVASGIHAGELMSHNKIDASKTQMFMQAQDSRPTYISKELSW